MKCPPEADFSDLLTAAFMHMLARFQPSHPEILDKIKFDNDAMETIWRCLKTMRQDIEEKNQMKLPVSKLGEYDVN